jgi:hypothetical protein
MARRLLFTALGLISLAPMAVAQDRPAVRIAGIRAAEETSTVRSQMPESHTRPLFSRPSITESRSAPLPAPTLPPPGQPVFGGISMGPATPVGAMPVGEAPPAHGGLFAPEMDSPLYAGGSAPVGAGNSSLSKFWVEAEYLMWWTQGPQLPVLVTTGPIASNGILGATGTTALLSASDFGQTRHSGFRVHTGFWFGDNQCWGLDGSYFFLGEKGENFNANSNQFPLIARPFDNLNQGIPFAQLTSSGVRTSTFASGSPASPASASMASWASATCASQSNSPSPSNSNARPTRRRRSVCPMPSVAP